MHLILTPSARLVRSIKHALAAAAMQAGKTQWQSANVQTLAGWLDSIVAEKILCGELAPQSLLSPFNEQVLWQQIIKTSLKNSMADLFDIAGLAAAAMQANQYLIAWHLQIPRGQVAEETRQFLQWQRAFQARCTQLNVLESVRYFNWQLDVIEASALQANIHAVSGLAKISRVEFAGFDQTAPQELRLREMLQNANIEVAEHLSTNVEIADTKQVVLENMDAECRAAVAWAQQQLTQNPNAKIAIVAPKLADIRNQLADLLDDVFYPASLNPNHFDVARNYNFSLGTPLSQQPMIQSALHLLRLFSGYYLQQADVSAVLLSPFWSSQNEADARAQLDAKLREYLPMQFTLAQLLEFAIYQQSKGLAIAQCIAHIKAAMPLQNSRKLPAKDWAQTFAAMLTALHWPGQRTLNSVEYQAELAWQKALAQLKQLDVLGNALYQGEAVQLLQKMCADLVFQAETDNTASIQILGVMEALSAPVDALWCMQMNDHIWPPPARPNPLLPANLQRAAKLPNADNSVQAAFAGKVQQRLLHSASQIVFSSSQLDGSSQLRTSPLLKDIAILEKIPLASTLAETLSQQGNENLVWLDDHTAPAVQAGEHVGGGTSLLRAQAICPAWAFYQYRLGAKALKAPSNGLDTMLRGILVHGALAAFWQPNGQLRHFDDLIKLSEPAIEQALNVAIKTALDDITKQQKTLSNNLLALEHERLFTLLNDWLAFEKERNVAFEIIACEAEKKVMIAGIEVTLKIDRIQQLQNGGIEFVDYKTGQAPQIASWGEQRLTEPQLPIYACFYGLEGISGVQFGMVKTAEHAFNGVGEANFEPDIEKRKPAFLKQFNSYQDLLNAWKANIEAIASEIKAGEASIKFDDQNNLAYCEVLPLLRLPERQLQFERLQEQSK